MALKYGFYNSDSTTVRTYSASDFSSFFDGLISDGVFSESLLPMVGPVPNSEFNVLPLNSGLGISVGTGKAWLDHTWNINDSAITFTLSEAPSQQNYSRIDTVVLHVDNSARTNAILVNKGDVAVNPVPKINSGDYILATVTVMNGDTVVSPNKIKKMIGLSDGMTKYVVGLAISPETIVRAVDAALSDNINKWKNNINKFIDDAQSLVIDPETVEHVLNTAVSVNQVLTATLTQNGWTRNESTNVWSQEVECLGMEADYNPILVKSVGGVSSMSDYNASFSIIATGYGVTGNNTITWYLPPTENNVNPMSSDITIGLKGV